MTAAELEALASGLVEVVQLAQKLEPVIVDAGKIVWAALKPGASVNLSDLEAKWLEDEVLSAAKMKPAATQ